MTAPRDWDKELAAIDKAMERMPAGGSAPAPAPAPPPGPPRRVAEPAAAPVRTGRPTTTWLRVLLVLALAVAMPFWPYEHRCGLNLYLYLAAAAVLVFAGIWGSARAWHARLGRAHVLSILVIVWGLGLVAAEVLPRVGYAAARLSWTCS